jgi:hypothetical protein
MPPEAVLVAGAVFTDVSRVRIDGGHGPVRDRAAGDAPAAVALLGVLGRLHVLARDQGQQAHRVRRPLAQFLPSSCPGRCPGRLGALVTSASTSAARACPLSQAILGLPGAVWSCAWHHRAAVSSPPATSRITLRIAETIWMTVSVRQQQRIESGVAQAEPAAGLPPQVTRLAPTPPSRGQNTSFSAVF